MKTRKTMCNECPFNPHRISGAVDKDVMTDVNKRIADGEQWLCHLTCGVGGQPNKRTMFCKGAKSKAVSNYADK